MDEVRMPARGQPTWRLLANFCIALILTVAASTYGYGGDAWRAAERLERDALRLYPWEPDSFRHPEQYDETGRKIADRKAKIDARNSSSPTTNSKQPAALIPDDGTGRPPY
jgi:hypothetical protein